MKLLGLFAERGRYGKYARTGARSADRPCAKLTPIVPIRFDEADSWFGGKPRLPQDISWPEQKGIPLRLACQAG